MKKFIICFMIGVFLLSGCSKEEDKIIRIFAYDAWMPEQDMAQMIQDKRIDEVNKILKEKGKSYQIELHHMEYSYSPGKNPENYIEQAIDVIKQAQEMHADIIQLDPYPYIDEFLPLDELFLTEEGQKLRKELPDHFFEANKVNGKTYYIPFLTNSYLQSYVKVEKQYYEEHKSAMDEHMQSPKEILKFLLNTYQKQDNQVLFKRNISAEHVLFDQYAAIAGTPLFIRRADRKIINPAENEDFMEVNELLLEAAFSDVTQTDETGLAFENIKEILVISDHYETKDLSYNKNYNHNDEYVAFPFGDKIPMVTFGYGLSKRSEHKDEAFDFLCEAYTDTKIADLMLYGADPQVNQNGEIVVTDRFHYGNLGNMMIATPTTNQKNNKKDIFFDADRLTSMKMSVPEILDVKTVKEKMDKLNSIWNECKANLEGYPINVGSKEEGMKLYTETNQKLKEAGIDEVIAELQKQVDAEV